MTALLDTSFLLAMSNGEDRNHSRVLEVAKNISDPLILPITVLPEVTYLLGTRMGHTPMRQFLRQLVTSNIILEAITVTDLERATEILDTYADSRLDFVDSTLVAIAERLNITRILSLDRRDFTIIRPKHCSHFEVLP